MNNFHLTPHRNPHAALPRTDWPQIALGIALVVSLIGAAPVVRMWASWGW